MELSVLAAWIAGPRETGQEAAAPHAAGDVSGQSAWIEATYSRFHACIEHFFREFMGSSAPQRKHGVNAGAGQLTLPVTPNVLEENVAESKLFNSSADGGLHAAGHDGIALLIRARIRKQDHFQGKAGSFRL